LNPFQIRLQPIFRESTHLQLFYLRVLKFVCKFLRIVPTNRCTWNGPGRRHARRDVTRAHPCVAAAPPSCASRTTAGPRSLGVTSACGSLARTPLSRLDRRTRAPRGVYALAVTSSPPAAHARRCRHRTAP
jgi:hypothetical protein